MLRSLLILSLLMLNKLFAAEFSVFVYNVENLFDVDARAVFSDYSQDIKLNKVPYSKKCLYQKIKTHAEVIARFDSGKGPDIIALQELEVDRSYDSGFHLEKALKLNEDISLEELLLGDDFPDILGFPIEFYLMKGLEELGLSDYHYYEAAYKAQGNSVHKNVILSRFKAKSVRSHPISLARDILEVCLDIEGKELIVFNNHWKSGASSLEHEKTRLKNARVMRDLLDVCLKENPDADILLLGDFNSYHNQSLRSKWKFKKTAINSVLGSQENEVKLFRGEAKLYNLWYELEADKRGSDIWKGEWGTLMQMILTRGLYDTKGIQYVDNSFGVFRVPDLNADTAFAEPIRWSSYAGGSGCSDHLPIYARFRVETKSNDLLAYDLADLNNEDDKLYIARFQQKKLSGKEFVSPVSVLKGKSIEELLEHRGELFSFPFSFTDPNQMNVKVNGREIRVYFSQKSDWEYVGQKMKGKKLELIGQLDVYRNKLEFIVRDLSWIL